MPQSHIVLRAAGCTHVWECWCCKQRNSVRDLHISHRYKNIKSATPPPFYSPLKVIRNFKSAYTVMHSTCLHKRFTKLLSRTCLRVLCGMFSNFLASLEVCDNYPALASVCHCPQHTILILIVVSWEAWFTCTHILLLLFLFLRHRLLTSKRRKDENGSPLIPFGHRSSL